MSFNLAWEDVLEPSKADKERARQKGTGRGRQPADGPKYQSQEFIDQELAELERLDGGEWRVRPPGPKGKHWLVEQYDSSGVRIYHEPFPDEQSACRAAAGLSGQRIEPTPDTHNPKETEMGVSREESAKRRELAEAFLQKNPDARNADVIDHLEKKRGGGIGPATLAAIRASVGGGSKKTRKRRGRQQAPSSATTVPDLATAVRQVLAVMNAQEDLDHIEIWTDGRARVTRTQIEELTL